MSRLRVALVGCGKIADQHLSAIRRTSEAEIVSVCDREFLLAKQLAERFAVPASFETLKQLLSKSRPDVVHITTPPQSHAALATECLEAGCHVYVEKPFTVNLGEAMQLLRLADSLKRKVTVGHNAQFTWESLEAKRLVDTGFLGGPPVHLESYYTYNLGDARYAKALLGDKSHWIRDLPGKLLHNVISHGIARISAFMHEDAPQISAFGYSSPLLVGIGENEVLDELRVHIHDGRNMSASFVFSSQLSPPLNGLRLYGRSHSLVVDNLTRTLVKHRHRSYKSYLNYFLSPAWIGAEHLRCAGRNVGRFIRSDFHDDSGMRNLMAAFYRAIKGEGPIPFSHAEILRTAFVMETIFAQLDRTANLPPLPFRLAVSPRLVS